MTRVIDNDHAVRLMNCFDPCYRQRPCCPTISSQINSGPIESRAATAWIVFCGKMSDREEDRINTDGTKADVQVTNLFHGMGGQGAILQLRRIVSLKNLMGI